MTQPMIFCPQCQTLLLEAPDCPACDWQRPAAAAEPGSLLWAKQIAGRWRPSYHHIVAAPKVVITHVDSDQLAATPHSRVLAYDRHTGETVWEFDLPPKRQCQQPQVAGDYLILTTVDVGMLPQPGEHNRVIALMLDTGEVAWEFPIPQSHSLSPPAVAHDLLLITDNQQTAYGLDVATGKLRWRVGDLPFWNRWLPAVAGEKEFFLAAYPTQIIALGMTKGAVRLVSRDNGGQPLQPASTTSRTQMAYANGRLFIVEQDDLVAVAADSGQVIWRVSSPRGVTAAPAATGDTVYLAVKEDRGEGYSLYALAATTGQQRWQRTTQRHFVAAPLLTPEAVYIGNDEKQLYALGPATGQVIWQTAVDGRIRHTPAQQGHYLYAATHRGQLMAFRSHRPPPKSRQTAAVYRQQGEWIEAGIVAALNGHYEEAAQDFGQADLPYQAAQLYEQAHNWEQAAEYYLLADRPQQALRLYRQEKQAQDIAQTLLILCDYEEAANQFEQIGDYAQAAAAFEKAGLMTQAAICYAQGGNEQRAIEIYLALDQPEPAAVLYQRLGQPEKAVHLLTENGLGEKAVQIWLDNNQPEEAARLWEKQGEIEKAAQLWLAEGQQQEAAALYSRHQQWAKAAAIWQELGDLQQAAQQYEKADQLGQAALLHVKLGQLKEAIRLYRRLKAMDKIAHLYEKEGNWAEAAAAYMQMTPPHQEAAAHCYQQTGQWAQAAELYEAAQKWEQAANCWQQTGQLARAAQQLLKVDQKEAAAELFWQAGESEQAFALLTESQAWSQVRVLAAQLNEHQREAEACLALAETAQGSEVWKLYQAAARAFRRAAEQQEQTADSTDASVNLWQQAVAYYKEGYGKKEDVDYCLRQIYRLRQLPEIIVTVKAAGELVEQEFHELLVELENIGYGPGRLVSVRVRSDIFEGDTHRTQKIEGAIWPNEKQQLSLRVRPHKDISGTAVPLDMELSYLLPDNSQFNRQIRGQVSVRRRDSQVMTPPHGMWTPQQMPGATIVYAEKAEVFGQGSQKVVGDAIQSGGQKGDKVEINGRGQNQDIRLSPGESALSEPIPEACAAGRHDVGPGEKFCGRCGLRVGGND